MICLFILSASLTFAQPTQPGSQAQYFSIDQISPGKNSPSGKSQASQVFNGRYLYKQAFESLLQYHITLTDKAKRDEFTKKWQHRFDNSGELNSEEGTDKAILAMVKSLGQRFDYYFNAEQTAQNNEEANGQFVGIGASLGFENIPDIKGEDGSFKEPLINEKNRITVFEAFEEGPAYANGMRAKDIFTAIDGKPLDGLTLKKMIEKVRGKEGTTVSITVERVDTSTGKKTTMTLSIVRKRVETPVVKFKDLGDGISYVKLANFIAQTVPQKMEEALKQASSGKALILDLRNNPGGNLVYAYAIAEMLMAEGQIVEIRAREGNGIQVSSVSLMEHMAIEAKNMPDGSVDPTARRRMGLIIPKKMPIVVLINGNAASASEIIAGALKFSRRGQTVGEPTHGKGVGQVVIPLPFNRTIDITQFEFRPNGNTIDWQGIMPDIEVAKAKDSDNQLDEARKLAVELSDKQDRLDKRAKEVEQEHRQQFETAK